MGPYMGLTSVELEKRQIDQDTDWTAAYHQYPNVHSALGFFERSKRTEDEAHSHHPVPDVVVSAEQQEVFEFFKAEANNTNTKRLCINQGKTGSGKLLLISFLASYLCLHPEYGFRSLKFLHQLV